VATSKEWGWAGAGRWSQVLTWLSGFGCVITYIKLVKKEKCKGSKEGEWYWNDDCLRVGR